MGLDAYMSVDERQFEDAFEEDFQAALMKAMPEQAVRPRLHAAAISCIVVDTENSRIWSDSKFETWVEDNIIDPDICDQVRANGQEKIVLVHDNLNRPLLLTYATFEGATHWPLPQNSAVKANGSVVVAALSLTHLSDDLIFAARALGMTNLEARVSAALVAHGSVRQAAVHARVTYQTARKAIAQAMGRMQVSRQTLLVRKLTELATSSAPSHDIAERLLIDIFGLKRRDVKLTLLLCEGHSRDGAAKIMGLSKAVAKDRFARIFEELGVSKAPEIPRLIMEAFAAAMLIKADIPVVEPQSRLRAPLRLFARSDGSHIAVSDYGPLKGKPVLIAHSSVSTRHPFRKVVSALQDAGFRPITIDRPGFGLTDNCDEPSDPFATGVHDIALVCKKMNIAKLHIITRGGAFSTLAFARVYPKLVGRVIVINPDLLQEHCSKRQGVLAMVRSGFDKYPDRIESVARWISGQLTPERTRKLIHMALRNSAIDLQSFDNTDALADYQKSVFVFATGRLSGFIREQRAYVKLTDVEGLNTAENWTIFLGEQDPLHNTSEILEFWTRKLPGANIEKPKQANRFISLTHTQDIIDSLKTRN